MAGRNSNFIRIVLAGFTIASLITACGGAGAPSSTTAVESSPPTSTAASTGASGSVSAAAATAPSTAVSTSAAATTPAQPTATPAAATPGAATTGVVERPASWDEESHGSDAEPDYAVVFPQDKVNQITINITSENWAAMKANLTGLLGAAGTGGGPGGEPGAFGGRGNRQMPQGGQASPDGAAPQGGQFQPDGQQLPGGQGPQGGGPGGRGGNTDMTPTNPSWVQATVEFNGQTWTDVGVRYKGNSSLSSAWRSGSEKLPLKLDFDQFEDVVPAIRNQRFYGFKQLSLGNGFSDATFMRDALSYDVAEAAGLVAPETAFYEVIVNYGEGPVSLGLYTMVEVVDDTVIENAFGDDSGNIYEGDGPAASLAGGTTGQIEASFQKENNEDAADWSDIQALYHILHSAERTTSPAPWRAKLEKVLDVDSFLGSLALNAAIQDWDQYGSMSHNYYLYHDPDSDRLVWIAWDHNMAFGSGPGRRGGDSSLDFAGTGANWPLIRNLLDDDVYSARYRELLRSTLDDAFDVDKLTAKIDAMASVLRPYLEKTNAASGFDSGVQQLKSRIEQQAAAVHTFLGR